MVEACYSERIAPNPKELCYTMLDFTPVRRKECTYAELAAGLTSADLATLTDEMVDTMQALIADCTDADVTFDAPDPEADDHAAATAAEVHMPWTLGHVIVHTTASAEESAFLAAELARGVAHHGRSRSEVPWRRVTTVDQCRRRLEESRRMRLASLALWPDPPDLDNTYQPAPTTEPINCANRFIRGLAHDDGHLAQIARLVAEGRAARDRSVKRGTDSIVVDTRSAR